MKNLLYCRIPTYVTLLNNIVNFFLHNKRHERQYVTQINLLHIMTGHVRRPGVLEGTVLQTQQWHNGKLNCEGMPK